MKESYVHGYNQRETIRLHDQASTLVDLGGYYYIKNPGLQILFAYGHSVFGQTENYAYLGLYQTWGKDKDGAKDSDDKGDNGVHGLLSRMLAGR